MPTPLYQLKAEFFKTLGHPARIRILELLVVRDHTVGELLPEIGLEASHLSHQLAVLRRTGLITQARRDGQVFYSTAAPEVAELLRAARAVLLDVINVQDALKRELAPVPGKVS